MPDTPFPKKAHDAAVQAALTSATESLRSAGLSRERLERLIAGANVPVVVCVAAQNLLEEGAGETIEYRITDAEGRQTFTTVTAADDAACALTALARALDSPELCRASFHSIEFWQRRGRGFSIARETNDDRL